jgi:hypothetical protein
MQQCEKVRQTIEEIHSDLYYEKLGPIISELRVWLSAKNKLVKQCFLEKSRKMLELTTALQEETQLFCQDLAELLANIAETMPKHSQEPSNHKAPAPPRTPPQVEPLFFGKSQARWLVRKLKIQQVCALAQTISSQAKKHPATTSQLLHDLRHHSKKLKLLPRDLLL